MNATEMSGRTDSTAGVINLFGIQGQAVVVP